MNQEIFELLECYQIKDEVIRNAEERMGITFPKDLKNQIVIVKSDEKVEMYVYSKFWYAFFAVSYPNGYDERMDVSVGEIVGELADKDWWDEFTGYYEGIFAEGDGYLDAPQKIEYAITPEQKLTIEFHPGDIIYYLNDELLGSTGPHWKLQVIAFEELKKLEELLNGKELFWLLLPLAKVEADEEHAMKRVLAEKLHELFPANVCESLAACMIKQLV